MQKGTRRQSSGEQPSMIDRGVIMWILLAFLSAFFAGLTAILAKIGIRKTDSTVATAIRTIVVLAFSWLVAWIAGSAGNIVSLDGKSLLFLVLSGLATGASWLCYFRALSIGAVNGVTAVDKSSTVLSVLLAIVIFGETTHLAVKLCGTLLIAVGTYLMIEWKKTENGASVKRTWLPFAAGSALFAALQSVLAKIGAENVESNLATAVRTAVVLVMAWGMVLVTRKTGEVRHIPHKELLFICLSGVSTGASWLCYYRALSVGQASVVVPIDKLSILITAVLAYFVFGEKLTRKSTAGLSLITVGTLAMAIFR